MRKLLQQKNILCSCPIDKGAYISILNIIQGEIDTSEIDKSLANIKDRELAKFAPSGPGSIQVAVSKRSPYV